MHSQRGKMAERSERFNSQEPLFLCEVQTHLFLLPVKSYCPPPGFIALGLSIMPKKN